MVASVPEDGWAGPPSHAAIDITDKKRGSGKHALYSHDKIPWRSAAPGIYSNFSAENRFECPQRPLRAPRNLSAIDPIETVARRPASRGTRAVRLLPLLRNRLPAEADSAARPHQSPIQRPLLRFRRGTPSACPRRAPRPFRRTASSRSVPVTKHEHAELLMTLDLASHDCTGYDCVLRWRGLRGTRGPLSLKRRGRRAACRPAIPARPWARHPASRRTRAVPPAPAAPPPPSC